MADEIVIPFGRTHRGKKISKVPSSYIKWMAENFEEEEWCCIADTEYQRRTDENDHIWED